MANLDEGGITVLPTHRLVKAAGALPGADAFQEAVGEWYAVEESRMSVAEALAFAREHVSEESGRLGFYLGDDTWVRVLPKERESLISAVPGEASRGVKSLAVTALHGFRSCPECSRSTGVSRSSVTRSEYLRDAEAGMARVDRG